MKRKLSLIIRLFWMFFLSTSCSHLFYQPDSFLYTDKRKFQKYVREVHFDGASGKVTAWQFSDPDLKPAQRKNVHLLFFHGNAQNVSSHFYSLFWILQRGYDFTIFDYPGYGGSEGEPTRQTTTQSGIDAYHWLKAQNPQQKIVIFGQSLGGNIALYSAAHVLPDPRLCAIAVESTFYSYHRVTRRLLARNGLTWLFQPLAYVLVSDSYSADDEMKNLKSTPLMVFHGNKDAIVEIENGREVFEAAEQPKTFVEVDEGPHIGSFTFKDHLKYQTIFLDFLQKNCVDPRP